MSCDTHHQIVREIYPKNIQAKFNMTKIFPQLSRGQAWRTEGQADGQKYRPA